MSTEPDYFELNVLGYSNGVRCELRTPVTTDVGINEVQFDAYREVEGSPVYVGEIRGFVRVAKIGDTYVVSVSFRRETIENVRPPEITDVGSYEEYPWSAVCEGGCLVDFLQIHDQPDSAPDFLPFPWAGG